MHHKILFFCGKVIDIRGDSMQYSVIIVAAGKGSRMGLGFNKVFARLEDERTILEHTISVFDSDKECTQIIVVTNEQDYRHYVHSTFTKPIEITHGGANRQDSVANGLALVSNRYVMVHDGARPYVSLKNLLDLKTAMLDYKGAVLMVPVKDTIKVVKDGEIVSTPDRSTLMAAQTPQMFETEVLKQCMEKAEEVHFTGTDDSSFVERFSEYPVKAVSGDYSNFKITTKEDL